MIDLVIAVGILGWFVGACFFIWDDITRLCDRMVADDVGAGGSPVLGRVRGTDGNACADTFPREWVLARSRPYDREEEGA